MRSTEIHARLDRLLASVRQSCPKKKLPDAPSNVSATTRLPSLPAEIWIDILSYATSLHPLNDYSSQAVSFLSLDHSHSQLQQRLAYYRTSMRRKALLTLVCKAWYQYAQQVLFEFVWISRASEARSLAALLRDGPDGGNGKYIRWLHIETSPLERCCPHDLRTILDCSPRLVVYSDYRSVRRSFYDGSNPQQLLSALAHPNNSLKRLSWTNYDDLSFHLHLSPMLQTTAAKLEYLELNFCSTHLHSMFPQSTSPLCLPADIDSVTLTLPALRSLKVTLDNATFTVLSAWFMPALENLSVVSADFSYTGPGFLQFFMVHGPKLVQLELGHSSSTIEEHYLTAPRGLASQHQQHQQGGGGGGSSMNARRISLAAHCPNLVQFICSADADWNWENPDWIAPHILMPSHPTLQFIGIRDIDKRLRDDMEFMSAADLEDERHEPFFRLFEQIGGLARREAFPSLRYIRDMSWESDVMRRGVGGVEGFEGGHRVSLSLDSSSVHVKESLMAQIGKRMLGGGGGGGGGGRKRRKVECASGGGGGLSRETKKVLRFWSKVLDCCKEGGVWMEDYRGVNVTMRDLRRAAAGVPDSMGRMSFEGFGLGW